MDKNSSSPLPLDLSMALMQNADAFLYFSSLKPEQRGKIIEESKKVTSRDEMRDFVASLS